MIPLVASGLAGAALIASVELAALRGGLGLSVAAAFLLLGLGLVCGLVMAAAEFVVNRFTLRRVPAALVRAALAVPPLVLVAAHLFEGGRAATMPGASTSHLWLPAMGYGASVVGILVVTRFAERRNQRLVLGMMLFLFVAAAEYANRTMFRSGYADVHAFLVVCSVVGAALAIYLTADLRAWPMRRVPMARLVGIAALVVCIGFGATLVWGLSGKAERWTVATRGVHTRELARLIRGAVDFDGDGFAAVLGGGDCDDTESAVNPGAVDTPGNGVDEDCDGEDARPASEVAAPVRARQHSYEQALATWRKGDAATQLLARTRGYNVVLVVVDALRADVLDTTADNLRAFPNLHRLAAESRTFRRAFAPASGTDVCMAGLLTGRRDPFVAIDTTMLEALSDAGRVTYAVLPREVLRWAGKTLLTRGLTSYDRLITDGAKRDVGTRSTGAATTARGMAFLDKRGADASKPWLLWLHYFDAHEHHQIEASDKRLAARLAGIAHPGPGAKYRAAVGLVDDEIGQLVAGLRQRKLWDRTVLVVVADHGESVGEDPRLPETHGKFLYNALVHIPLLIRIPGVSPSVIDTPVSLIDLTPTLAELAGATAVPGADGLSLLPHLVDGAPPQLTGHTSPMVLSESDQHGIIVWPHKLLVRPKENLVELYNLDDDFAEKRDLSGAKPALLRRMTRLLKSFPRVKVDRSRKARRQRERLAQPPARRRR